ncbi:ABC transporter ATP-binding protein [Spirulina sp. CS-785/01]|uniref:ABC transporter ATP-binding protein n=1 Tax=Spirulina sp. CS-785/01 TaxID=3021716 RepID=UPI00232C5976|nr:ABC transporter ATP-binding protein [Spirulina sp. CS-785/01]MDB9315789.1 ABC transporter ATP-binding protein [Spirulina sp. CS-785/01]
MSDTVLDVRNLQVQFSLEDQTQPLVAVDEISFQLQRGETLGIVGESGSGKSVTALALMGLVPQPGKVAGGEIWFTPERGEDAVDLRSLHEEKRRKFRGGRVAMIFQEPMSSLNPVYNIGFQLTEAIRLHQNVSPPEARRKAILSLQEVRLLSSDEELREKAVQELEGNPTEREIIRHINEQKRAMLKRYPHELSGGQLQRVMIAMAISCNPTLLIADEPTTALDVTVQATILQLLNDLCKAREMSLIFITHDLGVIAEIADQVAVMYKGEIVETGSLEKLFAHPEHPYTKGLLACRPRLDQKLAILPTIEDFMEFKTTESGEEVVQEKVAVQTTAKESLDRNVEKNKVLLSVEKLSVGFPIKGVLGFTQRYFMAVNDISFEVYEGETLGLVGESGCGKSTLARTLLRLTPELHGKIKFDGKQITQLSKTRLQRLRREMQIVFQNPYNSLNPRLSVGKTITEPLRVHNMGISEKKRKERAAYLLEKVGLNADAMKRYPHEFSGGQRQRVCIARALALNPRFIICDESVSALDVSVQAQVLNLLKELQGEFGLTYIFISHDLSVVQFMSDRIMVMNQGKIEEIDSAAEIYHNPKTDYTRQLIESIPTGELVQ